MVLGLTCNLFKRLVSVLDPIVCLAAFQNCFCAEYLFMGHILNKQSRNFFGGFIKFPASGQTTHRSSTSLKIIFGKQFLTVLSNRLP